MRQVGDPTLIPDSSDGLLGRGPLRNLIRQVQADHVDTLSGLHFLAGNDPLRICLGHAERHVQSIVVCDGDAMVAPLQCGFEHLFRVRKTVPGALGMQMHVDAHRLDARLGS